MSLVSGDECIPRHETKPPKIEDDSYVDRSAIGARVVSIGKSLSDTHANRHDQLQLLLHGARRNPQLIGYVQIAAAMQSIQAENALLSGRKTSDVLAQNVQYPRSMGFIFYSGATVADVVELGEGQVADDSACVIVACAQMVQRQVARSLENKGFQVGDAAFPEHTVDSQPCLMQQVFGSGRVVYDPLQSAQQRRALDDEQVIERRLTHKSTLSKKDADDNAYQLMANQ